MIVKELYDDPLRALVHKKEGEFRAVLDAAFPIGWTMDMVKKRCHLLSDSSKEVETLYIDGFPSLEIHPLEFSQERTATGWTMRVTQRYRRLGRGKSGEQE